jgi:CMP-N-acetylneuraminic acid synthetase
MKCNRRFLAIIPARQGSKRLPGKNKLLLGGKPLICWSIEAAKESHYIDEIIISSDDKKILQIAQQNGVKSLKRPKKLASDSATTFDVIKHVLEHITGYDYVVLLQPTSPLRDATDIDKAIEFLIEKSADAVISVCTMEHSPLWSNTLPEDKSMQGFLREDVVNKRSQDLQQYYRLNGAIYIVKIDMFLQEKSFFLKENIFAYIMSQEKSVDIDTELDFKLAQLLIKE